MHWQIHNGTAEKKISRYREYKCAWKIEDVFVYQLKSEYAKENGLEGRYLIIQKVDETDWWPCHTIPIVRVKLTKNNVIPKTEKEIDELEYIQTGCCLYENRFAGRDASRPLKEKIEGMSFTTDEYGLLPEYKLNLIITSNNKFLKELTYLGNYPNIKPPKNEFIPLSQLGIRTIKWQEIEKELIKMYIGYNKRNYEIYKKNSDSHNIKE